MMEEPYKADGMDFFRWNILREKLRQTLVRLAL
jgi:hypothetical protein